LWEDGNIVSEGGIVDLVNENTEKDGGLVACARLKSRVDLDDERGGNCQKQTSLMP
jgi:hypothetical protein